jgi:hypothetical protein
LGANVNGLTVHENFACVSGSAPKMIRATSVRPAPIRLAKLKTSPLPTSSATAF